MVTIQAANGDLSHSASFTAVSNQDQMHVFLAPSAQVYTGDSAGRFAIQLFRYDGSFDYGQQVVFTAPGGVLIDQCASTVCTQVTDGSGVAVISLATSRAGTFALQCTFGAVTANVSFVVVDHTLQLSLVSAPAGNVPIGTTASAPFSVQLLQDGLTPIANADIGVSGPNDSVTLNACNGIAVCKLTTDSNGMVSTTVTPIKAGAIALSALYAPSSVTATFTATGPVETMRVTGQPGANGVLVGDPVVLSVQLIGSDGTTVYPNKLVSVTVTNGSFAVTGCSFGSCLYRTDANGMFAVSGTAISAGAISLVIADDLNSQTISFNAASRPDVMQLISAPASGGNAGTEAGTPFAVQVLFGDGITLASGRNVTLSVTQGAAGFAACAGLAACTVQTGSAGTISTAVTPLSGGSITLSASEGGVTQTATFTAAGVAETMQIVSVPANGSTVGSVAAASFSVRVTAGDGVTPLPGHLVTLSATNARLGACGLPSCVVVSDASGLAQTGVTPLAAGVVTLAASDGAVTRSTSFNAAANTVQHSLSLLNGALHVIEGAIMPLNLVAVAAGNGSPAAGQPVHWMASPGLTLAASDSATGADGSSTLPVTLGPLGAGVQASATACAWTNVCATFSATGVSAASLQITLTAGAQQAVSGGATLGSVQANVTDGQGNAVAGASVSVFQTVTSLDASCSGRGRCPTAPLLLSKTIVVASDSQGNVTIVPLSGGWAAAQTEMIFSVGTQGSVTTVLTQQP